MHSDDGVAADRYVLQKVSHAFKNGTSNAFHENGKYIVESVIELPRWATLWRLCNSACSHSGLVQSVQCSVMHLRVIRYREEEGLQSIGLISIRAEHGGMCSWKRNHPCQVS